MKRLLITGSAGFIGFNFSLYCLKKGHNVVGIDNINDYYDRNLKKKRLNILKEYKKFKFYKKDLSDTKSIKKIFQIYRPHTVINLAAQAGVRYSIKFPMVYLNSNINGFQNILELCVKYKTKHLIYASSSSVYGLNKKIPFNTKDTTSHPISVYAATKKSNELMAHVYSNMYKLPTTGLRFFTVYGPWGRPDMSLFKFVKSIIHNKAISVYNYGNHTRDFTSINDAVRMIYLFINKFPKKDKKISENRSIIPWRIFNLSSNRPVKLLKFIKKIEKSLNKKAKIKFLPLQKGDVKITSGSMDDTIKYLNYKPKFSLDYGIKTFIDWYKKYYNEK